MTPTDNFAVDTATNKWTDFYARNPKRWRPFHALLFETNVADMARTAGHLNNVSRLTEIITESDYRNMLLVHRKSGTMQLIHHGFACNTADGFSLAFAHGNLKTLRHSKPSTVSNSSLQRRRHWLAKPHGLHYP